MEILQSIILGIVQGITEFLPISSSAHLVLIPRFFGWEEQSLAFDAMLHLATLLAIILYFKNDLIEIVKNRNWRFVTYLAIASIPAGLAGIFLADQIDSIFKGNGTMAFMLVFVGLLMAGAEYYSKLQETRNKLQGELKTSFRLGRNPSNKSPLTTLDSGQAGMTTLKTLLILGFAQAFALIRGTSRSGVTITAGIFSGLTREKAARLSFILGIPIIAAASAKSFVDLGGDGELMDMSLWIGFLSAFISGYFAIRFLLNYLKKQSLYPFVIYRILLAVLILMIL